MLARRVLGTSCRAALGLAETVLGGLKSIWGSSQHFYSALSEDITYRELKNVLYSKYIRLIDVRDTWEILEHGKVPGSINVPLDEVGEYLQVHPRDFKEKYHEVKQSKSDSLVFSCFVGVRSKQSMDTASSLGFNSALYYTGDWKEWVTYEMSENKQEN
ncbi:thiosulfate sulfurtransferase/rhodanese-like domain-containing protein 3 [Mesocricetus auratus]|uniref:Thiosulfate sulfurtransferase/rhodanese-like domain-containing protein 3 n=1 Tax=Mesocricetus auratus TaxID=10036 RepID=A0ABM2XFN6_MESAU|nr:thiosulfate sulfurtransferase/rhodanese-like domain-containing protein 3 [Mesocricetus auratus]